jgi:NADPH:quinone reductase-like Zn-dependent oxidoreductase
MKLVALPAFGIDALSIREQDTPAPGAGQVLVRVHAASLNFRDLRVVQGLYDPRMPLPRIPFSDGAGEVSAIGSGVTRWKVGDRVAGIFMQDWIAGEIQEDYARSALGGAIDGMLAEYVVLPEHGLVALPRHLSWEEGATLPCAAVTAWNSLVVQGRVKAGDTVLVQGTGGVSLFALQLARAAGARVIVTSSSAEKLERALGMGATEGLNYREIPEWGKRVRELTHRRGVDHVIEVGGSGTLNQSMLATRVGGHIAFVGVLTGVKAEITTAHILQKSLRITGVYVGSRQMFEDMNRVFEQQQLRPVIDRVYPMTEVKEALRYMESARHFGKIVLQLT